MKNKFIKLLSLAVCCIMLFGVMATLGSCGFFEKTPRAEDILALDEEERAYELFRIADRASSKADTFTAEVGLSLNIGLSDLMSIASESTTKVFIEGAISEVYKEHSETDTTVTVTNGEEEPTVETVNTVQGFIDGKLYRSTEKAGSTSKMWSPITKLEYFDHKEFLDDGIEIALTKDTCFTATLTYNDDGTWVATFTDFFSDALETYENYVEAISTYFPIGTELDDVTVEIGVTEDFLIDYIKVDYIYKNAENGSAPLPTVALAAEIFDYNATEVQNTDLSEYTEIADIRVIDKLEKTLSVIADKKSAEFNVTSTQTNYLHGDTSEMEQTYNVTYSNTDGKFASSITHTDHLGVVTVTEYMNGKKIIAIDGGDEQVEESSDLIEKEYVKSLITSGSHLFLDIIDVEKDGSRDHLTIAESEELRELWKTVLGADTLEICEGSITVKLDGGKLVEFTYEFEVQVKADRSDFGIYTVTECVFE